MTESELYRELGALTKDKSKWEVNIPYTASGHSSMTMVRIRDRTRLKARIASRIWLTRLYSRAPRFCPTIELPAVVKDWEITPHMMFTLLNTPASAE